MDNMVHNCGLNAMFLKCLSIENFRRFRELKVEFKEGLNVLIGENDSGKTAIIDGIRYLLNTKSFEPIRFDERDFYQDDDTRKRELEFEIVGIFSGFEKEEAAKFLDWGGFDGDNHFELRVALKARLLANHRVSTELVAGPKNFESRMDSAVSELLKVTYLKPLRDAETELTPGYRSRLAQILQGLKEFERKHDDDGNKIKHKLEDILNSSNEEISNYLDSVKLGKDEKSIVESVNSYVKGFNHENDLRTAGINITDPDLNKILRNLGLTLEDNLSGLGTLNKLFMATELLHLETDPLNSVKLCLIEELEAHLHPQAQLRVIEMLQKVSSNQNTQIILTTHSTTIGSSIDLDHLIICNGNGAFPMWRGKTGLSNGDYKFLQRFLDSTKANLFFSKGVILVEGDAENILIPTVAKLIGRPLNKYGVSIVNVGSTAFLRYSKIFNRIDGLNLDIPVSVITDLDVRAIEFYEDRNVEKPSLYSIDKITVGDDVIELDDLKGMQFQSRDELKKAVKDLISPDKNMPNGVNEQINSLTPISIDLNSIENIRELRRNSIIRKFKEPVKVFTNEKWTLEYDLALSDLLKNDLFRAIELAKCINLTEGFYDKLYNKLDGGVKCDLDENIPIGNKYTVAYEIFKPFVGNNKPSKAVTSQIFSEILESDYKLKGEYLRKDKYLNYIVKAIDYACGYSEGETK
ncbi:ATP-dependent nuclease [Yersinia enterocolitica]